MSYLSSIPPYIDPRIDATTPSLISSPIQASLNNQNLNSNNNVTPVVRPRNQKVQKDTLPVPTLDLPYRNLEIFQTKKQNKNINNSLKSIASTIKTCSNRSLHKIIRGASKVRSDSIRKAASKSGKCLRIKSFSDNPQNDKQSKEEVERKTKLKKSEKDKKKFIKEVEKLNKTLSNSISCPDFLFSAAQNRQNEWLSYVYTKGSDDDSDNSDFEDIEENLDNEEYYEYGLDNSGNDSTESNSFSSCGGFSYSDGY